MPTSYRFSLIVSLGLHSILLAFLLANSSIDSKRYVVKQPPKAEIVKAVSINNQQVMAEISRIKEQKEQQRQQRIAEQNKLKKLAEQAKSRRLEEQQKLALLKKQARELEEKQRVQKRREAKRLAAIKRKRAQEQKRLARLKREQQALKLKQQKEQQEQAKLKAEKEKKLAAERAKKEAAKRQAQLMGVVNKYKALIVQAIGQNWILPDNADKNASCKFEIKLAPGGAVMSVKLLRSSGDTVLDRSAQTAIYKASPLPVPADKEAFNIFRVVSLTVRPESVIDNG